MGENDFNRVAESDDKEESCEIFIELSASEIEDKSDKGDTIKAFILHWGIRLIHR